MKVVPDDFLFQIGVHAGGGRMACVVSSRHEECPPKHHLPSYPILLAAARRDAASLRWISIAPRERRARARSPPEHQDGRLLIFR